MKVYLASPFFNEKETAVYDKVIAALRKRDIDLFVPREHTIPNAWDMPNQIWAENVFAVDYLAITQCDVVVVLNFGMYSDSGTAWECGCAYALGKKVINVLCMKEGEEIDFSLMMLNGTTAVCTLDEIFAPRLDLQQILCWGKETNEYIEQK